MNRIPRNVFSLLLALASWTVLAQPTNCITFDEPAVGTVFNANNTEAGEVIYQYEGVNLIMDNFTDQNGQTWFDQITVLDESLLGTAAPLLFVNYANATFEFLDPSPVVCFTSSLSGHEINFGINGEVGVFDNWLDPAIQNEFPNYDIVVTADGDEPGSTVDVCIYGVFDLLTMGGIEFALDNFCSESTALCAFNDPNLEAFCTATGSRNILVDFSSVTGNNDFVDVFIGEQFYNFYPIDAFPIVLENVIPNAPSQNIAVVTVCINDATDCCYVQDVPLPNCSENNCLTFEEPALGTVFSTETGVNPGEVVYQYPQANLIMDVFTTLNGGTQFDQIQVVEGWTPNLTPPSLYVNYATATFDYHIPVQELCFDGFVSGHEINFGLNGTVAVFESLLDPTLLTAFPDVTITVTPSEPNTTGIVNVCVSGLIEQFTIGGIELLIDNVCANNPICNLFDLQAAQYACDDNSLPPTFYLNFQHNQAAADSFRLLVNNNFYGIYAYGDLPVTDIEVPVNSPLVNFSIEDMTTEGCTENLTVAWRSCEEACEGFFVTGQEAVCVSPFLAELGVELSVPPTGQTLNLIGASNGQVVGTEIYNEGDGVIFLLQGATDPEGYFLEDELSGCITIIPPLDFDPATCVECDLSVTTLTPTDCNPNGVYGVTVDIESATPWQFFRVLVDGDQLFGPFALSEFPVTVGSVVGTPGETTTVRVSSSTGDCVVEESVSQDCLNSCANFAAVLNGVECLSTSNVLVSFNLTGVSIGEPIVISGPNGNVIEELTFAGNPVLVDFPSLNGIVNQLLIEALEINCETELAFELPPDCGGCADFGIEVIDEECTNDGNYLLTIQLFGIEPGEVLRFTVDGNPNFVTELTFESNPVQIEVPPVNTNFFTLFAEAQIRDCFVAQDVAAPEGCLPSCGEYDTTGIFCEGNITVLTFVANGPANGTFTVQVADEVFEFTYGEEEYELVFNSTNLNAYEFIFAQPGSNCITTLQLDNPCPIPCEDRFAVVESFCSDGELVVLFTAEGEVGNPFFVQISNDTETLTFEYGQSLYEFTIPPPLTQAVYELLFFDDVAGCEVPINVENACGITPCEDFSIVLENVECLQDSLLVSLFIGGIAPGEPLRFTLSSQPNFVLEDIFQENSYQLVIPYGNSLVFELLVEAQGIECEQEVSIGLPDDCFPACEERFEVLEVVCLDDGNTLVLFNAIGPTGGLFYVTVSGEEIPFTYGEAVYELVLTDPAPNNTTFELRYEDALTGCVVEALVDSPCFCFIEVNDVAVSDCDPNGGYFVELDLSGATSWGTGLFVIEAGGFTQTFEEGGFTTTIGPFFEESVDIIITEVTSELCSELIIVEQNCEPNCEIFDLIVEGTECDNDGNYFLEVTFEANNAGPFTIINDATGESQTVTLDQLPAVLGPYNFSQIQTSVISVFTTNNEDCAVEELYVHECENSGECGFSDIFAEPYECIDGQFLVDVAFENPGGSSLGFYIFGDGMIFGPYQYGEPFYTFGPLDGTEEQHEILILDIADPACFGTYEFDFVCSDECNITEVTAEVTECDGEVFNVELDVIGSNLGVQFIVVGNGNNYGTFSYDELPITLGPFAGDNETVYEFGIIDLSTPGCTSFTEVGPVNCQPCEIRDFTYEVDCGAEGYALTVDFILENPESDGFRLFVGTEEVGTFPYENGGPYTIELPYAVNGNTVRVEDFLSELCGETIDFELPCCSLGNILNEFAVADCEANGEYYFIVNEFNGGNLSDSLVINYAPAGSTIIATEVVAYSDLPAEIGPLSGDGETDYLVVLSDQENACAATTTIEAIYCDNNDCVEFEDAGGVYGPLLGQPDGTVVAEENGVAISYEENPNSGCNTCNLFITDGIPGVAFGSGLIAVTQNSGLGLDYSGVSSSFNTVNIDFYYTTGTLGFAANGNAPVIIEELTNTPIVIAPGVELQITTTSGGSETIGTLTFSGDNIESLLLFSNETAAFDNVCLSTDDNVWPGDANSNNVANHIDLLSIGLTYGFSGPARMGTNSEWNGFIGPNWGGTFADGLNHKHADANGDGVVDLIDEDVLEQNYGLVHGPVEPFEALPHTDLDPPVFIDIEDLDELTAGTNVEIPIVAGTADQAIEDIYGLAFTLELDPEIFDMGAVEIIYPTSWFGEPGINTTHIHRVYPDGRLEVALSRTDHNNVSGFGPIMYLRIIIDDIAGINEVPTELFVNGIMAINHEEERLTLRPGITTALISSLNDGTDRDVLASTFGIYPNPTLDVVYFKNAYHLPPNRLDLFSVTGQQLASIKDPGMEFDFRGYPAGVYLLQFHIEGKIFTKRLVKLE